MNSTWDRCEKCKYSSDRYGSTLRCRRYPPHSESQSYGEFPLVRNDSWCGEFKSKYGSD